MGIREGSELDHSSGSPEQEPQSLPEATETPLPVGTGDAAFDLPTGEAGSANVAGQDQLADNEALAAIVPTSSDDMAGIGHTLDQLATATNLFDVPALDFDGTSDS
jgi:hypothetical protein